MIFNFNKLLSDLDIDAYTPDSRECKHSKLINPSAGHVVTGNLKIIPDSRIRYIVSKGPKYRFHSHIDFNRCREEIGSALNDFGNRWCNRESVKCNALKECKLNIFNIVDKYITCFSHNTNLLPPKIKSFFIHLKEVSKISQQICFVPADKAANNIVVVCRLHFKARTLRYQGLQRDFF